MSYGKSFGGYAVPGVSSITMVEADISFGLHSFAIVGLGDKAISEAKDRISAAIKNTGRTSPKQKNQKIVISLVPAHVKKEGTSFDVAMALAYLNASGEIRFEPEGKIFIGELGLDGTIRKVQGVLPILREARKLGYKNFFVPTENSREAGLIHDVPIFAVQNLGELIDHLEGRIAITPITPTVIDSNLSPTRDISEIKGLPHAKRALEIAAAGFHSIALYGPPGTGKTSLIQHLPDICPSPSYEELLEINTIYSASGLLDDIISKRPFRSPHHSSSHTAILGGGSNPRPGEISLAHHGVLFLDEFPHFDKRIVDGLREPLEEKVVRIVRTQNTIEFPANTLFAIALNPCPCGNHGITGHRCTCTSTDIQNYQRKISGPIIDRVSLWVQVPRTPVHLLRKPSSVQEGSKIVQERVEKAFQFRKNTKISFSVAAEDTLAQAIETYKLSPRVYKKLATIAKTIASLELSGTVVEKHILEALTYRPKGIGGS